jgi:hypothetical protein
MVLQGSSTRLVDKGCRNTIGEDISLFKDVPLIGIILLQWLITWDPSGGFDLPEYCDYKALFWKYSVDVHYIHLLLMMDGGFAKGRLQISNNSSVVFILWMSLILLA